MGCGHNWTTMNQKKAEKACPRVSVLSDIFSGREESLGILEEIGFVRA